jgi:8-oxo-dGTP pyrophosphatase MutT (NUDIX family)
MGAGVIPFAVHRDEVYCLFHKTFSGRRAGCLVDFGGNQDPGEGFRQTAIREFIEETEGMYLAEDVSRVVLTNALLAEQTGMLDKLFADTLGDHPGWYCDRRVESERTGKSWRTFFIRFPYRELAPMNREWERDGGRRFKKRRELVWVPAAELLHLFESAPERLWKRVRRLDQPGRIVRAICDTVALSRQGNG